MQITDKLTCVSMCTYALPCKHTGIYGLTTCACVQVCVRVRASTYADAGVWVFWCADACAYDHVHMRTCECMYVLIGYA